MKIIDKAIMKNGTKIQLEDWTEHNTTEFPDVYGLQIGAYPIAERTGKYCWIRGGEPFRLTISANKYMNYTNDDVKADFDALKEGRKTLEDLSAHFWNGKADMWYLGMPVENKGY